MGVLTEDEIQVSFDVIHRLLVRLCSHRCLR